ncbi:MAG TPA: TonB-dependent receptor, partial [Cyclobacteriaceae bacterium]|nr:TonB-dependent receptor [Cyclobacteriaceae bacterium]
ITEFLAKRINDLAVSAGNPVFSDVSGYLATFGTEYLRYLYNIGLQPGQISNPAFTTYNGMTRVQIEQAAMTSARSTVDNRFILDPNSAQFQQLKNQAMNGTVPDGPRFKDHTRLYHGEFQYDFKNLVKSIELITGGSYREYDLRSNGTIFADKNSPITITEFGGYVSAAKWLNDRKLKLSASGRYDKNLNFKGRFNPRVSALIKLGENSNIRVSYQTGFRIPSTQAQHIDLSILTTRLLGGLPQYAAKYDILRTSTTGQPLSFDGQSVSDYSTAVFNGGANQAAITDPANTGKLHPLTWNPVKPEKVQNIEIGYKSLIDERLMIDVNYYYNIYNDFITQVNFRIADQNPDGTPNYATLLNGTALGFDSQGKVIGNSGSIYTNYTSQVTGEGAAAGLTYSFRKGYTLTANYNWNKLIQQPDPAKFQSEFNTPEHKGNFSFGNRKVKDNWGFNVTWRWQNAFFWQSSFTSPRNGFVPAFQTTDAQISYRLPKIKSVVKFGGSNIFNLKYFQSLGGPNIGAIYYVQLTFDQMFK